MLAALKGCALPPPASEPARQSAPPANALVKGNRGLLLVDGPRTYQAMFGAIEGARDHVNIETYILDAGEAGQKLARLLAAKVEQGVKVQVMYDAVGSISTPREYFRQLADSGAAVCEFNPVVTQLDRLNNRDHRKITVVDGRIAFTGGINISATYSSSSQRARAVQDEEKDKKDGWRDTEVEVEGPVVAQFQRVFLDDWALQDCGPWAEARYFPPLEARGDQAMRVVRDAPGEKSETYAALLAAIAQAKHRVWLTYGYFVPDPQTKRVLLEAARRGVDVRLVLPGFTDFWAPVYAGRSHYGELLDAGVRIYEWHEALLHAKTAVIDSAWASVGSTNLDWRSRVHNYEADLIVQDAAFARALERRFELDIAASAAVDPEKWRRRSQGERLKEWFARQWEYLL